jgi:hypothetical protein
LAVLQCQLALVGGEIDERRGDVELVAEPVREFVIQTAAVVALEQPPARLVDRDADIDVLPERKILRARRGAGF